MKSEVDGFVVYDPSIVSSCKWWSDTCETYSPDGDHVTYTIHIQ